MDPLSGLYIGFFLVLPFLLVWAVVFVYNHPGEEIRNTARFELLGPGGPDDPFAARADEA